MIDVVTGGEKRHSRAGRMLAGYLANRDRGPAAVRAMMVADNRRFSELGATVYAADLKQALIRFDASFPAGQPQALRFS